ncbi:MAG: family transposase [Rhizobium sp.]|nr:family transposase [Rhizobium sp.]
MATDPFAPPPRENNSVSPRNLAFLRDNEEAFKLLDQVRWIGHAKCPRCGSMFTKEVNTSVFRELTRCLDCSYMFNQLSGTMFQGSKIPLVKFYQLFIVYDASEEKISSREVSYVIDVSDKTAQSLLSRLRKVGTYESFTTTDQSYPLEENGDHAEADTKHGAFFLYCGMKSISVDVDAFKTFLALIVNIKPDPPGLRSH